MNKDKAKTKEIDEAEAVSANEMTGLIPARPETEENEDNYFQVLHYKSGRRRSKK